MKKIIYALLILGSPAIYAQQNVVYRCIDVNGNVSYANNSTMSKSAGCQKTDLADPDKSKGMVIRSEGGNKVVTTAFTSSGSSSNISAIKSDEQKKKDEGRLSILTKELADEQEQLVSVQKMIKNVESSKDIEQVSKLKDMENRHFKNISTLKRELGVKEATQSKVEESKISAIKETSTVDAVFNAMMIKKEIKMNPNIIQVVEKKAESLTKSTVIPLKTKQETAPITKIDESESRKTVESFLNLR